MRRPNPLLLLLLLAASVAALLHRPEEARAGGTIVFVLAIEPKRGGEVLCALYKDKQTWLTRTTFRSARAEANASRVSCQFPGVPGGTYAMAALHDENRDGKMNYILFVPREGYAASRDAHFKGIGAPSWDDAAFSHNAAVAILRARMRYW